jgi:hypothetical protein
MKTALTFAAFLLLFNCINTAFADYAIILFSQDKTGVFNTALVRFHMTLRAHDKFVRSAPSVGFKPNQIAIVAAGIKDQSLESLPGGQWGRVKTSYGEFAFQSAAQSKLVIAAADQDGLFLQTFAIIRLEVKPVPPRDYRVNINGEDCPATERALYRVLPGSTNVSVLRKGKPTCNWVGDIQPGEELLVACSL